MASLPTMKNISNVENAFKASKKHKNKKKKKEKKDKIKKHVPDFLLDNEAVFTQMPETKKRKKPKKKIKPKDDSQEPRLNKKLKQPDATNQTQPIIYLSPDQETPHSTEEFDRSIKRKKRVIFKLPHEQSQATKTNDEESRKKQLVGESGLEPITAEEINSQDLFITQKSFLDPYVEISSSSSCSEAAGIKAPENHLCRLTAEATTQTENFFTFPALSTSLRFQQQQNASKSLEEPVDLSLPYRTRQMQSPKQSAEDSPKPLMLKISDTSSEDSDTVPKAKGDLLQLKVIQTRLNESFFFRVKGEDSPKPMCPLMKLKESVEKRQKK